jgi:hypothetical protein
MESIRQAEERDGDAVLWLASQLSPEFAVEREVFSASFSKLINEEDVLSAEFYKEIIELN